MSKSVLFIFLLVAFTNASFSQQFRLSCSSDFDSTIKPLYVVNNIEFSDYKHLILNPNNIKSIDILTRLTSLDKYGQKGKYGVIVIKTKDDFKFHSLVELYEVFNIDCDDRLHSVYLNSEKVLNPNFLRIDIDFIKSVKKVVDCNRNSYISIITNR